MSDQLLDATAIQAYLAEVADELGSTSQRTLIIVGGALLAWHGLRDSTRDVDTVERLDRDVKKAIRERAQRRFLVARVDLLFLILGVAVMVFRPGG